MQIGHFAVNKVVSGLFQQCNRPTQILPGLEIIAVVRILRKFAKDLFRQQIFVFLQQFQLFALRTAGSFQSAVWEISFYPLILVIKKFFVRPVKVKSQPDCPADVFVLKLRAPQVERKTLKIGRPVVCDIFLFYLSGFD